MKKTTISLLLLLLIFLISGTYAETIVTLSANTTEITIGETLMFHLEIYPDEAVGGRFSINREVKEKHFKLEKTFMKKNSCTTCGLYNPLYDEHIANYIYEPTIVGNYYAVANFGDADARVNFTVKPKVKDDKKETYCASDSDCACGVHIETGACFYGNKNYVNAGVTCPDFCSGIAGTFQITCADSECIQVGILMTTTESIETTTTTTDLQTTAEKSPIATTTIIKEEGETCSSCGNATIYKIIIILVVIIVLIYIIFIDLRKLFKKKEKEKKK